MTINNVGLFCQLPYEKSDFSFGVSTNLILVSHQVDFNQLPGVESCCPHYSSGNGSGLSLGLNADRKIDAFSYINLNISYIKLYADLSSPEFKWIELNNQPALAEINHTLTTTFNYISLEPSYKYSTPIGLIVAAGLNFNIPISASYNQSEVLVKPENEGTFENGKRIRYEISGKIEKISILMAFLNIYAEYNLQLDNYNMYSLAPKLSYSYGLNSLFLDRTWKMSYFALGIQLKYNPFKDISSPLEPK